MTQHPWPPRSADAYYREASDSLAAELLARFCAVRALIFDADGVLTGGQLMYDASGEALKEFHSRDGLGLVLARVAGFKLAVLTGRQSEIVRCRAEELQFDAIKLGRFDKLAALAEINAEIDCESAACLYMGDDLVDLPALYEAGLAVTVPEAPVEVRQQCHYVTRTAGGQGAVREVIDLVLKSQRLYTVALERIASLARHSPDGGGQ